MQSTYLLLGPEKGLKQDFIDCIKKELGPCNTEKFFAFDDYEDELFAQMQNADLFVSRKLIILDEAQEIKTKEKASPIVQYIKQPSEDITFIIMSKELYINADIMAAVPDQEECIKKFYELSERQKPQFLTDFFRQRGMTLESDAAYAIIERVENNIQEFRTTCSQMADYIEGVKGKKTVECEDVEEFITHTREETESSLFSYIARRNLEGALGCLTYLFNVSDASQVATMLCTRLSFYIRRALSILFVIERDRVSFDKAVKGKFFDTDRPIAMPKDKDTYKICIENYSMPVLKHCLVILARYDIKIKEGGTSLYRLLAERCVISIIKSGRS